MRKLVFFFLLLNLSKTGWSQSSADTATGHYYTSFDGTRIYYETKGSGPKTVLLIHGFMRTGADWKQIPLYQALLNAGFEIVVPDLRGNGKSDKPHEVSAYQHDAESKDLMGIMDQLGVNHYSVVGYSRGSIIAARLLVLDPRVNRVILGGMGTGFTDTAWARRKMFYQALMGDSIPELADMVRYVQKSGLDQRALALQQYGQPSTSPKELARVSKPVLVICGDQDQDNGSGKDLTAMIPLAQFMIVPGNHGATMSSPEFSADALDFLQK